MKKYISLILSIILMIVVTSCKKEYKVPDFKVPHYAGTANKTIEDIRNIYASYEEDGVYPICTDAEAFVIKVTVVSSDEATNFYKKMVVQDETGAIEISINRSGLFAEYPVGQDIFIDCSDLYVGAYGGVCQLGWADRDGDGSVDRIDQNYLGLYFYKDGLPHQVMPEEITNFVQQVEDNDRMVCRLVRLKNCHFAANAIGHPWSEDAATTERKIDTLNGAKVSNLIVRTVNYCNFHKMLVPAGTGDLVGIMSVYKTTSKTTYQLILRSIEDVYSFGRTESYSVNLLDPNWILDDGWNITSDPKLVHEGVREPTVSYAITPKINLVNSQMMMQWSVISITDSAYAANCDFAVEYTTNYEDPEPEWIPLEVNLRSGNIQRMVEVGQMPSTPFRIRFSYITTDASTAKWQIKAIQFNKFHQN